MIIKKVASRGGSKRSRIQGLGRYIRDPQPTLSTGGAPEKCIFSGARGFISDDPSCQLLEMIALAEAAVRSRDPINHYVVSWMEGEAPTAAQVEEAMDILMEAFGLDKDDHQIIYGLHNDTDNIHLHVMINRVSIATERPVKINQGFDREACHRACARIEHAQGWQVKTHARYRVGRDGGLVKSPVHGLKIDSCKQDREVQTGGQSAQTIAQAQAAVLFGQAKTWEQLHADLAELGFRYEKKGSGAVIFVGDTPIKASSVSRQASLSRLEKRLGTYQADRHPPLLMIRPEPEPIRAASSPGWQDYHSHRQAYYRDKSAAKIAMDQRIAGERESLYQAQRAERKEVLGGHWHGKGNALNAMRSVLAAQHASQKAALQERVQRERERFRIQYRPYPGYEQWLTRQQGWQAGNVYRHRDPGDAPAAVFGDTVVAAVPRDMRAFAPRVMGSHVHYTRRTAPQRTAFVDKGQNVIIHDWRDRDTTLAALQLSAAKWGHFMVTGNDEYKALCVDLAVAYGFQVDNPELQERVQQEKQARFAREEAARREQERQEQERQARIEREQAARQERERQAWIERERQATLWRIAPRPVQPSETRTAPRPEGQRSEPQPVQQQAPQPVQRPVTPPVQRPVPQPEPQAPTKPRGKGRGMGM